MNFALIGCGLIGKKRLGALPRGSRVVIAADLDPKRAETIARDAGAEPTSHWQAAVERPDVQAVIVSTTNNWLAPVTLAAIQAGKHVLVEKPAAIHARDLDPLIAAAERHGVCVQAGFNHRYHPAPQKCRELIDSGVLGDLMFIRGRYGHGGRLGYDREWRSDPAIAGGGELIDQGVHLIDLSRWFLGEFVSIEGSAHTYFWNMPVDDNSFLMLKTARQQTAWLHVSCTEWKNMFSLEIYGRQGKLHVEGLGGSYGLERLAYYRMLPEMGPPETTIWEYPGEDRSWKLEIELFERQCAEGTATESSLHDAKAALEVVEAIYRRSLITA